MSYFEFHDPLFVKTMDTNEEVILGSFNLDNNYLGIVELEHLRVHLAIENFTITNERLKLQIHGESTCNSLIAESSEFIIADIDGLTSRWNGMIRFDFSPFPLNLAVNYYMKLVPVNYTRPSLNSFISFVFNWPISNTDNVNGTPWLRPITFEPFIGIKQQ